MNYNKLSSTLCTLIKEYEDHKAGIANDHLKASRPQGFSILNDNLLMTIFIHCEENAVFGNENGITIHSNGGKIRTAQVTIEGLEILSGKDEINYLSSSIRLKPLNDIAAIKTGLNDFKVNYPGLKGRGVIVGIIDSGIDSSHTVFANRIHSIWDQTITGSPNSTKPYGEFLQGANLVNSSDTSGHGTHIAGIIAGSDVQFGGVAPEADIVVVKTDFQTSHIADAIRHIFTIAKELNKPAVINLAAGGHFDAHDGTDDLSKFIDQETSAEAGRIIVVAAGNEANEQIHATVTINAGELKRIPFQVAPFAHPRKPKHVILRAWFTSTGKYRAETPLRENGCRLSASEFAASGCLKIFVSSPANPTGCVKVKEESENPTAREIYGGSDNTEIYLTPPRIVDSTKNLYEFLIDIRRTTPVPPEAVLNGEWKLKIENWSDEPVGLDVWAWVTEGAKDIEFNSVDNNPKMKIGSPGCASEAITVASYTTRQVEGQSDNISQFTSPGPLRNGGLKPDVAAPGEIIISAYSQQSNPPIPNIINGGFRLNSGTSMAAAFIAGVCALFLQHNRNLTPLQIKTWLKKNSHIPAKPAMHHDEKWGFGFLDLSALQNLP